MNRRPSRGLLGGAVLAGVALTIGIGGVGYTATGGNFILGGVNSANRPSTLTNTTGTALSLTAPAGTAPLAVSNPVKVNRLNADLIDGVDSSALQLKGAVTRVSAATFTPSEGPINRQARVFCAAGEHAVGGGGHVTALTPDRLGEYYTFLVHSAPITAAGEPTGVDGTQAAGWLVEATNTANALTGQTGRDAELKAYVVCEKN